MNAGWRGRFRAGFSHRAASCYAREGWRHGAQVPPHLWGRVDMATAGDILSTAGGLSGIVALLGAAVGYGRLQARLSTVERDVGKLSDLGEKVSRIDERTKNTDDNVKDLKGAVQDLTSALLNGRAYGPAARNTSRS